MGEPLSTEINERTARKLKPKLKTVTARIQKGEDPAEVIQADVQEARQNLSAPGGLGAPDSRGGFASPAAACSRGGARLPPAAAGRRAP